MPQVSRTKVRFEHFREFEAARRSANDALTSLLIGSRIAAHYLSTTCHPETYLPELLPDIGRVQMMNRTVRDASDLIVASERHLATMALPYVQGVLEMLVGRVVDMLGQPPRRRITKQERGDGLPGRFRYLTAVTGLDFDPVNAALLDLVRLVRNCVAHGAGYDPQDAWSAWESLDVSARDRWVEVTRRELTVVEGALVVESPEMIAALAVMKFRAREINGQVCAVLSEDEWAAVIVDDFARNHPRKLVRRPTLEQDLLGYKRFHYGAVTVRADVLLDCALARVA